MRKRTYQQLLNDEKALKVHAEMREATIRNLTVELNRQQQASLRLGKEAADWRGVALAVCGVVK